MSSVKDLDLLLQSFVDKGIPGCALKVVQNGTTLYEGYFGHSDTSGTPLTDKSVFRLASMSKIPLYTAMMMLYERGAFLLSDPVSTFFPEWATSKKYVRHANGYIDVVPTEHPVTIRDTLTMKCGLPYCNSDAPTADPTLQGMQNCMKPLWEKGHYTLREQIRAMADAPLAFEPGSHWLYGFSSELMAGLIEVLTEKPAEMAIKELLFEPLDMESSANFLFNDLESRLVKDYYLRPGKQLGEADALYIPTAEHEAKFVGKLGTVPGFARVITNCRDYTKLMQMLANGGIHNGRRIIGRKTIDLIRSNTLTPTMIEEDFSNTYLAGYGYGYGMRTLMNRHVGQNNGNIGQFGWTGGSGTWAEADPSTGVSVVYMHNLQPNLEEYHHLRMRATAFGCLNN